MYFSCNVSFASLPLFVPTIIYEIGAFTELESNGLSAPPYLLLFFVMISCAILSDKLKKRGPFVGGAAIVAAVGFILLGTTTGAAPRYLGIFLAVNIFASVTALLPWITNSFEDESTRAAGFGIFATLGQSGPVLGTNIFPYSDAPCYRKGSWISWLFCLLIAALSFVYTLLLRRENRKLDKIWDEERRDRDASEKGFRYSY